MAKAQDGAWNETKVGDAVAFDEAVGFGKFRRRVVRVEHVTASQIVAAGRRWRRRDGQEIGAQGLYRSYLLPVDDLTQHLVAEQADAERRAELVERVRQAATPDLPVGVLEQVLDLLAAAHMEGAR